MAKLKWDSISASLMWNRVKSLRRFRGLSQPQVAVGAGVAVTTVYFLENGFEERATEETKKKLAAFFEVDVEDIFPAEMIGNEPRDRFLEKMKIRKGEGHPFAK